jgi:hypothetical protein
VTQPLVSIYIPTYNRPDYLRRTVESCLKQTYPHFEIIITDNSTNRDSEIMLAGLADPRLRYFSNNGNIGPHASAVRAMELCAGKFMKPLMDDDLIKPRCLELMVKALEDNPSAGVVMAPMDLIDENDTRFFPKFYLFRRMHYRYRYQVGDALVPRHRILKDFLTRDYPCTVPSGLMFRRETWLRAQPFTGEADFAGDLAMCMRFAEEWDFYYIDQVLSSWRLTASCHTATLHQTGLKISVFYWVTRHSLASERVQKMFAGEWDKFVRDSLFFCSCRALLNGVAGLRSRDPKLILSTVKTIITEDKYILNWFRLPWFVAREIFVSIFPRRVPPPRE